MVPDNPYLRAVTEGYGLRELRLYMEKHASVPGKTETDVSQFDEFEDFDTELHGQRPRVEQPMCICTEVLRIRNRGSPPS